MKFKISRIEKVIKNGVEINEKKNRKRIEKINEIKSCFFEINKIDKLLPRKNRKKNKLITSINSKKVNITTFSTY